MGCCLLTRAEGVSLRLLKRQRELFTFFSWGLSWACLKFVPGSELFRLKIHYLEDDHVPSGAES